MLSESEAQKHLTDCLFHGLCEQWHDLMHYLYDDPGVMYPQLVTRAHKAELEQKDWLGEEVWVRWAQSEGRDDITNLRKQIAQLCVVMQRPQGTASSFHWQSRGVKNSNRNQNNTRSKVNNRNNHEKHEQNGIRCFQCEGWGHRVC